MEDEPTLMDVFKVLVRRWKLIVAITLVPTIVVAAVLLGILLAFLVDYVQTARTAEAAARRPQES
jgi:capsular polysaccharide biosynthesis protein